MCGVGGRFFQSAEGLNRMRPASLSRRKFSRKLPQTWPAPWALLGLQCLPFQQELHRWIYCIWVKQPTLQTLDLPASLHNCMSPFLVINLFLYRIHSICSISLWKSALYTTPNSLFFSKPSLSFNTCSARSTYSIERWKTVNKNHHEYTHTYIHIMQDRYRGIWSI